MGGLVRLLILLLLVAGCAPSEQGEELFHTGEQAFASGRFILAEQSYEQYLQQYDEAPLRWEAWNRLLLISRTIRKEPQRSLEILQSMSLEFEAEQARILEVLHQLALVYRDGLGQSEKAVDVWQRSFEACPSLPGACWRIHWHIASTYFERGQYPEAREELESALQQAENDGQRARAMYMMAKTYALTEDRVTALSWLERLLGLEGYEGDYLSLAAFMAADIHVQEERIEQARAILSSILETHPNPELVRLRLEQINAPE